MKRLHCKFAQNTRDIGGIYTKSGHLIRENRFIRSGLPKRMEQREIAFFLENKIDTVIDLRQEEDIRQNLNVLNTSGFHFFNVPLLGEKAPDHEAKIPEGYLAIINDKPSIRRVLTLIAEAENGIFFNCTAGKDRTGVISMLLLLIAGAYESDIIADYQVSYTFIREEIRNMHRKNPHLPSFLGQSKMEYMEEALLLFKKSYGSIEHYLDFIRLDRDGVEKIKDKLFH